MYWVTVALWASVACTPHRTSAVEQGPIDEAALQQVVAELVPAVEAAAGRSFDHVPYTRIATRADLERVLQSENQRVLEGLYPDAPPWVRERLAADARGGAESIVGKYGIETKVLYLAGDAVDLLVARQGLGPRGAHDAARLVLAHELTHALQDQVLDLLPDFVGQRDADSLEAFAAITEGHANFVEHRVAEVLGLTELELVLQRAQGWTRAEGPIEPGSFQLWFRYGQGETFVAGLYAAGGNEAVWGALAHPPATTTMILRPERYDPLTSVSSAVAERFRGVESTFGDGAWISVLTVVGEATLRPELDAYPAADRERVLAGLVQASALRAFREERQVDVRVLRFVDADAATAWMDLVGRPTSTPSGGLAASVTVQDAVDASGRRQVARGVDVAGLDSMAQEDRFVVDGDTVLQVQTRGFRPGLRMDRAVTLASDAIWKGAR